MCKGYNIILYKDSRTLSGLYVFPTEHPGEAVVHLISAMRFIFAPTLFSLLPNPLSLWLSSSKGVFM